MEYVGYVAFALLFLASGLNHVKNHSQVVGYAASGFGNCPFAVQLGYLGGWPTGLYLVAVAVLSALGEPLGFYGASAFLVASGLLYHRDIAADQGVALFKNLSLAGAAFAIATLVV